MNEAKEIIRTKVSVRDAIGRYCNRPIRRNRCACPIHNGSDYNMEIFRNEDGTESYYCWVCHSAGDSIKFVSQLFSISYSEAMKVMDREFGCGAYEELSFAQKREIARREKELREREKVKRDKEQQIAFFGSYARQHIKYCEDTIKMLIDEIENAEAPEERERFSLMVGEVVKAKAHFERVEEEVEEEMMRSGS